MPLFRHELAAQANVHAAEKGIALARFLGDGNDGAVWESNRDTAVKVVERTIRTGGNGTLICG